MTNYQAMCAAATEFLGKHEFKIGDQVLYVDDAGSEHVCFVTYIYTSDGVALELFGLPGATYASKCIPLYSIKDLIAIAKRNGFGNESLFLDALARWNFTVKDKYLDDTVPERILKFTMEVMYNKTWDGERWA